MNRNAPLIVVGMRFRPHYAKSKPTTHDQVCIIREPHNDVNIKAVSVHFKHPSVKACDENKIGYIRDADLHFLAGMQLDTTYPYKITRVCTNYLKLEPVPTNKLDEIVADIYREHHDNGDFNLNPCEEIDLPYYAYEKEVKDKIRHREKVANFATAYGTNSDNIKQTTEKKTTMNITNMRDSFFKEVKNVALDMQSGKLGVVTKDGIVVADGDGVSINPITEMGFTIPAFAMRVPIDQLVAGDIIISSGDPVFYKEGTKAGYLTVNTSGVFQEVGSVSNLFFGKNTVMAVKNMFGGDNTNGMNPMLMMAMFSGDKGGEGFDFKKMMMMQMMMGNNQNQGGFNPMMFMMMDKM